MPRVVPSQIVSLIDTLFPQFSLNSKDRKQWLNLAIDRCYPLRTLIDLIDQMPPQVIVLDSQDYSIFSSAIAAIRTVLEHPKHLGHGYVGVEVSPLSEFGGLNPVAYLRDLLCKCPDEFPESGTSDLSFIEDKDFRESLRNDISAINRALVNSEWKGATVLAGSVLEAVLYWAIKTKSTADIDQVTNSLYESELINKKPASNALDTWHLAEYIEVARELKLVKKASAAQAKVAKDFRNLIHPGRTIRAKQTCNRGTAFSTVGAMDLVIEDIIAFSAKQI